MNGVSFQARDAPRAAKHAAPDASYHHDGRWTDGGWETPRHGGRRPPGRDTALQRCCGAWAAR
eukprot:gene5518-20503_t